MWLMISYIFQLLGFIKMVPMTRTSSWTNGVPPDLPVDWCSHFNNINSICVSDTSHFCNSWLQLILRCTALIV